LFYQLLYMWLPVKFISKYDAKMLIKLFPMLVDF